MVNPTFPLSLYSCRFAAMFVISFLIGPESLLNWPMVNSCYYIISFCPAMESFIVCWQFHAGLIASRTGTSISYRHWSLLASMGIAISILLTLLVYNVEISLEIEGSLRMSVVCSILLSGYRFLIAFYCIWAFTQAMKIFAATKEDGSSKRHEQLKHMSRRLKMISFLNVCCIAVSVFIASSAYIVNHGWLSLLFNCFINGLISIVDLMAIPANLSRPEALSKSKSHLKNSKALQSSVAEVENDCSCLNWLIPTAPSKLSSIEILKRIPNSPDGSIVDEKRKSLLLDSPKDSEH
jgi:hypothetical protein